MKKAVVVVGPHFSGKSKTIKRYFKPLIGLSGNQRKFDLRKKSGVVLSQSLEEKRLGRVLSQSIEEKGLSDVQDYLSKYLECHWLVIAARPATERGSHLDEILAILNLSNFSVLVVDVIKDQAESFYEQLAKKILDHLT